MRNVRLLAFAVLSIMAATAAAQRIEDVDCATFVPPGLMPSRESPHLVPPIGHVERVASMALTRDGRFLVSGGQRDGAAIVWDAAAQVPVLRLENVQIKRNEEMLVAVSPLRDEVVVSNIFGLMTAWDLTTLKPKWCKQYAVQSLKSLSYSSDGTLVIAGGSSSVAEGGVVRVFNADSGSVHSNVALPRVPGLVSSWQESVVAALHPDGDTLATALSAYSGNGDRCVALRSLSKGAPLGDPLCGAQRGFHRIEFSADGSRLLGVSADGKAYVWNPAARSLVGTIAPETGVLDARFAEPKGQRVVTAQSCCEVAGEIKLWNVNAGGVELTSRFSPNSHPSLLAVSLSRGFLYAGTPNARIDAWDIRDVQKPEKRGTLNSVMRGVRRMDYYAPARLFLIEHGDEYSTESAELRDLSGRRITFVDDINVRPDIVGSFAFRAFSALSPKGDFAVLGWKIVDAATGDEIAQVRGFLPAFSPDGAWLYTVDIDGPKSELIEWNTQSWEPQRVTKLPANTTVSQIAVSRASGIFATFGGGTSKDDMATKGVRFWKLGSAEPLGHLERDSPSYTRQLEFSADGQELLIASFDLERWSVLERKLIKTYSLKWQSFGANSATFIDEGKHVLATGSDGTARIFDTVSGELRATLTGHFSGVSAARALPGGNDILTAGLDGTVRAWRRDGTQQFALIVFKDGTQAAVAPDGRFDAPPGAAAQLVWARGITLLSNASLMRTGYLDPDLAMKALGIIKDSARQVASLATTLVKRDVEIEIRSVANDAIVVRLPKRDKDLGDLVVSLDSLEVYRRKSSDVAQHRVDLAGRLRPGTSIVRVDVFAARGDVIYSRKTYRMSYDLEALGANKLALVMMPTGIGTRQAEGQPAIAAPAPRTDHMRFWALVVGAAYDTTKDLNLLWADQDAKAIAAALKVGAEALYAPDRVKIALLNSTSAASREKPTRKNILRELETIRKGAALEDTVVLYLAGHGDTPEGANGAYLYLTDDIKSKDELQQPQRRSLVSINSEELKTWFREMKATRRAVIVDTCRAGQLDEVLKDTRELASRREVDLELLASGHGLFLIAGSASNRVSYEATPYGHGLLTYALLLGIKGAAGDGDTIQVKPLFDYAKEQTTRLAAGLKRDQTPQFNPRGEFVSFPLLTMSADARKGLRIENPRPLFVRSRVEDADREDSLGLSAMLNEQLEIVSRRPLERDPRRQPAYQPVDSLEGAYRIVGSHVDEGGMLKIRAQLNRSGKLFARFDPIDIDLRPDGADAEKLRRAAVEQLLKYAYDVIAKAAPLD